MIMKQFLRKTMKNVAAYVELFLSAVLVFVIVVLIIKLIGQRFLQSENSFSAALMRRTT